MPRCARYRRMDVPIDMLEAAGRDIHEDHPEADRISPGTCAHHPHYWTHASHSQPAGRKAAVRTWAARVDPGREAAVRTWAARVDPGREVAVRTRAGPRRSRPQGGGQDLGGP